jgi:hypothetical protein
VRVARFTASQAALIVSLATSALGGAVAGAQGTYEIEVYSTEIVPVKSLLFELHSNYTFRGSEVTSSGSHAPAIDDGWIASPLRHGSASISAFTACTGGTLFQRGAYALARPTAFATAGCGTTTVVNSYATHESLELVTGLSAWSEVGAYLFSSEQRSPLAEVIGGSIRAKVRIPDSWHWPVGVALSTEVERDDPRFTNDPWSLEIRPVIERALGRWYLSANPTLERTLQGTGVVNGLEFSPSAKASFDFSPLVSGGVEYYGAYGKIGGFAPPASRLQQVFGTVDLHLSPVWEVNAGVGAGATSATNHLVAKLILGRRISWN